MVDHLFSQPEPDVYLPNAESGSPWHPGILHGGPIGALLAHAIEQEMASFSGFRPCRLTMDYVRPVPKKPLAVDVSLLRDGGRLKLVHARVHCDGKLVAKADAVYQKQGEVVVPDYAPRPDAPPAGPHTLPEFSIQAMLDAKDKNIPRGFHSRIQVREVTPWNEQGETTAWIACPLSVLEGQPSSSFVYTAMMSDLSNGTGQLNFKPGVGSINADVNLTLYREPVWPTQAASRWLCFESKTLVQPDGLGAILTRVYDEHSLCGYVTQSIQPNGEFGS